MSRSPALIIFVCAFLTLTATGLRADPPNTAILDGRPTEYDGEDLRSSFAGSNAWGTNNVITNLYVTWDETYLYIALQGWEEDNKLAVLLDVDPGYGTGATTTTNWAGVTPDFVRYNDVGWEMSTNAGATPFGLDYMFASEGFYNNIVRVLYDGIVTPNTNTNIEALFDNGNGATPTGAQVDMVVQADGTRCELKGFEARIPWSELYNTNLNRFGTMGPDDVVPTGATLRLFANLHNNDPDIAYSSPDAIPVQTSPDAYYTNGLLSTDTYLDIVVDNDDDGIPDVAPGDVNAPFIRALAGLAGKRSVYALFNEDLVESTATNEANWTIGTDTPEYVQAAGSNAVLITLTNDLPAEGTLVKIAATNVQDAAGNQKYTYYCLFPTSGGLETSVTVRFYLETSSGLGINPGASNFFINGSATPLEWGYPPAKSSPLAQYSGSVYYRDVTFPPGAAATLNYKYSGELTNTGTNNYEAIRLVNFADASRLLELNTNGMSMVVTDYLGAAAGPWRDPGDTNTGYNLLYNDVQRGDAGVRDRSTVTFQLDLSARDIYGITRVLVQGSDPLRGFNQNASGLSDWAGGAAVGWSIGGLALYDDGTHGDTNAGDKIFARTWVWSTSGQDSTAVPLAPNSLVGGSYSDLPYGGLFWKDRRSPRSFTYKFYVVRGSDDYLESPTSDREYYFAGGVTNVTLPPFVWDNPALPPPPPSNSPTMSGITVDGGVATVVFSNEVGETQHGVQISTNLLAPWLDYGQRAIFTQSTWQAEIQGIDLLEGYRAFAGAAQPYKGARWEPNPLPSSGGTLRIYFNQHSRALAGDRNVQIAGSFNSWGTSAMTFMGDGLWYYDAVIDGAASSNIEFKARNLSGSTWCGMGGSPGGNYYAYKGLLRASWEPNTVTNGELMTITYDAAGGNLETATNVNAYVGFDEGWYESGNRTMTNVAGTVWEIAFPVPTNYSLSVNFVFNGNIPPGGGQEWDSESSGPIAGRQWRAFIAEE